MDKECIEIAFAGDTEILDYYDRSQRVTSIADVCENVYQKLASNYSDAKFEPVEWQGEKIGYLVWSPQLLISFGINKKYRNKEVLRCFWERILARLGEEFSVSLFDHNTRAIQWLQKCGMQILGEHITILVHVKK